MTGFGHFFPVQGDWGALKGTVEMLSGIRGDHAGDYHDNVEYALIEAGWSVRREYAVVIGDGLGGRVDIVAQRHKTRIALELDNRTPRGKSLIKLTGFPPEVRTAVLLRNPK